LFASTLQKHVSQNNASVVEVNATAVGLDPAVRENFFDTLFRKKLFTDPRLTSATLSIDKHK
jgi:hypothetical protein